MVLSAAGPVEALESFLGDYSPISFGAGIPSAPTNATGYYNDHLWLSGRVGLRPETAFVAPAGRAALREWDSTYKLSGYAAYCVTMKFDKDGERFASGVPQWGAVFRGPRVYDPRLDETYPGGFVGGPCRWNDEFNFPLLQRAASGFIGRESGNRRAQLCARALYRKGRGGRPAGDAG